MTEQTKYKMLPLEPTQEMDDAGSRFIKQAGKRRACWDAMLAAAPDASPWMPIADVLALLEKLGPQPWETTETAFAQQRLITDFKEAIGEQT